jgi:hypothetical protein
MIAVEHGLIIKFIDESESFTAGFEAGQVFEKLSASPNELIGVYHFENGEMLFRIGRHFGYEITFAPSTVEGWAEVTFTKPVRPRLSVVR